MEHLGQAALLIAITICAFSMGYVTAVLTRERPVSPNLTLQIHKDALAGFYGDMAKAIAEADTMEASGTPGVDMYLGKVARRNVADASLMLDELNRRGLLPDR